MQSQSSQVLLTHWTCDIGFAVHRKFVKEQKYKTEAETFGWSFVFQDFVSEETKGKVTEKIEVCGEKTLVKYNNSCFKNVI